MQFRPLDIAGAWVIDPSPHQDARGRFMRAWCQKEFADMGIPFAPLQANMGYSPSKGTIRGMHFQTAIAAEAKLVRCTRGSLFDVVVDLRPESSTYRQWRGVDLTAENGRMLLIPELCAHGCQTLEDGTELFYLASAFFAAKEARGIRHDDPAIGIKWPLLASIVSDQDRAWPLLERSRLNQ